MSLFQNIRKFEMKKNLILVFAVSVLWCSIGFCIGIFADRSSTQGDLVSLEQEIQEAVVLEKLLENSIKEFKKNPKVPISKPLVKKPKVLLAKKVSENSPTKKRIRYYLRLRFPGEPGWRRNKMSGNDRAKIYERTRKAINALHRRTVLYFQVENKINISIGKSIGNWNGQPGGYRVWNGEVSIYFPENRKNDLNEKEIISKWLKNIVGDMPHNYWYLSQEIGSFSTGRKTTLLECSSKRHSSDPYCKIKNCFSGD